MKKTILFSAIFLKAFFVASTLLAQEICNDGIDNDGDGFVDCYDSDCRGSSYCEDFFMGDDATCEAVPTEFPTFSMKKAWGSANGTASTWSRVSVGDVDGDGIPEVIVTNREKDKDGNGNAIPNRERIFVLNGNDGSIKQAIPTNYLPEHGVTMGKIDGAVWFFISGRKGEIEGYKFNSGNGQFERQWNTSTGSTKKRPVVLGLADFKGTGNVQLYYKNEIRDAKTGTRLVRNSNDNWENSTVFAPVAVDILDDSECTHCTGLELVAGGMIYAVNLGDGSADNGSLTKVLDIKDASVGGTEFKVKPTGENWSSTSVADYDQDGYLDVIASGADKDGKTTIFYWNVKKDEVITFKPENNWEKGAGRPNIADFDGDGKLNVTFVSGSKLFGLDENLNEMWSIDIRENTSGFTGTSVFDFNGDGKYEIVYRDEEYLHIINGADGSVHRREPCRSRTSSEYPVVADVDGDGATEICVVCNYDDDKEPWNDGGATQYGHVRVYKSNGETWVPSRKVWNQHTYFNVNVNDDLTIPRQQQKHHIRFEGGDCDNNGNNRPLNTFLNQSPYLDIHGCPTYGAPDFTVLESTLEVDTPMCPDRTFTVSFDVRNDGDVGVSGTVPITFYIGNPLTGSGQKLNTIAKEVKDLKPGTVASFDDLEVIGPGSAFTLYISFNDSGKHVPPITLPNGGILECNYDNNIISTSIEPKPFPIVVEKLQENLKCDGDSPDKGAAEAYVLEGTNKVTAGYTFSWYKDGSPTAIYEGPVYTGMEEGTYTVIAEHNVAGCHSVEEPVEILLEFATIESAVKEELVKHVTSCDAPNGELVAYAHKGDNEELYEADGYTFTWYRTSGIYDDDHIMAIGHKATGLEPDSYSVVVVETATGCESISAYTIENHQPNIVVDADITHITSCLSPEGGVLEASVGSSTTGYTFKWYKGTAQKLTPDYEGALYSNLEAGDYSVIAVDDETGCESALKTFTVNSLIADPAVTYTTIDPTTCAGVTPNGSISLTISTPAPGSEPTGGYTIRWYEGTGGSKVALPAFDNEATADELAAGTYTVMVTHSGTTCPEELHITLEDEKKPLSLSIATVTNNTICDPAIGFDGAIELEVKSGSTTISDFTGLTFEWFDITGPSTPITSLTPGKLENLKEGKYRVRVRSALGCTSNTVTVDVQDGRTYPVIATVQEAEQTSCDSSSPNGSLSAHVGGNTSDYTFEWFEGSGTGTPLSHGTVSGANGELASGLKAGNYTVRATLIATGCSSTSPATVDDNQQTPQLTRTIAANTICDPNNADGNPYDGQISLAIEFGGVTVADFTDYTITWYEGNNTSNLLTGETSATLSNIKEGQYTVVVSNDNLGCTTQRTYTVGDGTSNPIVSITTDAIQTSCDENNPNGALSAHVGGSTSDYTFEWFEGSGTGTPLNHGTVSGANGESVSGLKAGNYTVRATATATGCVGTRTLDLNEDIEMPTLALDGAVTHFTNCSAANGEIAIVVTDLGPATAGHTYTWYKGGAVDATKIMTGETGPSVSDLTPGKYTVVVTNNFTHCASATFTAEVEDHTTPLTVVHHVTDALECNDGTNPPNAKTGEIEIQSIDGITLPNTRFSFEWMAGIPTDPNATFYSDPAVAFHPNAGNFDGVGKNTHHLRLVESRTYSVIITDHDTDCKTIRSYHVDFDGSEEFDLANTIINHSTICFDTSDPNAHGNGSITLQLELNGNPVDATDYIFRWYRGTNIDENERLPENSNEIKDLSPGSYTAIAIRNFGGVAGCQIADITIEIKQIAQPPVLTESIIDNTYCVGNNGEITVTASKVIPSDPAWPDDDSDGYNFTWYDEEGNDLANVDVATGPFEHTLSNLAKGDYTVRVTNLKTGCFKEETYTVQEKRIVPQITDATFAPQDICKPSGSIEVTAVEGRTNNIADYTFTWYREGEADPLENSAGNEITDHFLDASNYPNMGAGTYYVTITATDGTGCTSPAYEVTIDDDSVEPTLAFEQTPNTACDLVYANGSLTATATTDLASVAGDLTFTWFIMHDDGTETAFIDGTHGDLDNSIAFKSTIKNVKPGLYKVNIEDTSTGCDFTDTWEVKDKPIIPKIDTYTALDQDICDPSGSITITNMEEGSVNDYIFTWYKEGEAAPLKKEGIEITDHYLDASNYPDMGAGKYYVTATINVASGKGCETGRYEIIIGNKSEDPELEFAQTANTACNLDHANGTLKVTATTNDIALTNATFEWFVGPEDAAVPFVDGTDGTIVPPVDATTSRLENVKPGVYTVKVTDHDTGCHFTDSHTVEPGPVYPVISGAAVVHQDKCSPSGSITIENAHVPSGDVTDYTFTWYRGGTDASNIISGVNGHELNNVNYTIIGADTYYVIAKTINGDGMGCETQVPFEVEIDDIIPELSIETLDYSPHTSCTTNNGEVSIIISNDTDYANYGSKYDIKWYEGDVEDAVMSIADTISTSHAVPNLTPNQYYTVQVEDLTSECSTYKLFFIEDKTVEPIVNPFKVDVTYCDADNGEAFANVINKPGHYVYEWHFGHFDFTNMPTGSPYATGQRITGLSSGVYTVFVIEQGGDLCEAVGHVTIEENKIMPIVTIMEDAPLTNCDDTDPRKSNGQLSASVGGNIFDYRFEWYFGTSPTGAPASTGPVYSGLTNATYTVRAINRLTGCYTDASYTVSAMQEDVPAPHATVLDRTNCEYPNGQITVTMDGNLQDYRFTWYRGNEVRASARINETGTSIRDLDIGSYTVTATSLITGCTSAPVTVNVGEDYTYPDFEIITQNASCMLTNGLATLEMTAGNSQAVIWETAQGLERGTSLRELPAGTYNVTVISSNGCSTTKEFTIGTDINVFNGVSPNGDNRNDFFEIDCITDFPTNNVKIFNRAGTLVFEMNGYDNETKVFEGKGNRGLYLIGDDLPDGTYFYVVEKNDGSKPKTGYLELLR